MGTRDWSEKDYYAVLGVAPGTSHDTVKRAFRALARQHHPDANAGSAAAERRFKRIGEAYGVLSHPERRAQYDAARGLFHARARSRTRTGARSPARHSASRAEPSQSRAGLDDLMGWWSAMWWSPLWSAPRRGERNPRSSE